MAVVTIDKIDNGSLFWPDLFFVDFEDPAVLVARSDTSFAVTWDSPDWGSVEIRFEGTGLVYSDGTFPTGERLVEGAFTSMAVTVGGEIWLRATALDLQAEVLDHVWMGWMRDRGYRAGDGFDFWTALLRGDDQLIGSDGDDDLIGGRNPGNDTIFGGGGRDWIKADAGNDVIDGGDGRDVYSLGESFWDVAAFRGAEVDLGAGSAVDSWGGTDSLTSIEEVVGSRFADRITGSAADDRFAGSKGRDTIDGGGGYDIVRYDRDADHGGMRGVVVNLATGVARDGWGQIDSLSNIESVFGTRFGDRLTGNAEGNWFIGGDGTDSINGGAGYDTLEFWKENVGAGAVADLSLASGQVLNDGFGNVETLVSIENLYGTFLGDRLTGNQGANRLEADYGDDTIFGGAGTDTLVGGGGVDALDGGNGIDLAGFWDWGVTSGATVNLGRSSAQVTNDGFGNVETLVGIEDLYGTFLADNLTGSRGANWINGNDGNDTIGGGAGNDTLTGGGGMDRLTGGVGSDFFVFDRSGEDQPWGDRITDFQSGTDRLAFDTLDFEGMDGTLRFQNGTRAGTVGESWFYFDGATNRLFWDADGRGGAAAILVATLTGVTALMEADFDLWT